MQVNSPSSARAAWYDRNRANEFHWDVESSIGPHALTTRFIYTVPTGRKCRAELGFLYANRDTAATSGADISILFYFAPNSTNDAKFFRLDSVSNTVGSLGSFTQAMQVQMQANDQIYCQDIDVSTGGTVSYEEVFKGTSFDA